MIDWDNLVVAPLMKVFGADDDKRPVFKPAAGGEYPVNGVFDRAYRGLVVDADGEPVIATREPVLGVRLAEFPVEPVQGDRVLIPAEGKTFVISNVEPDGKGWALLRLNLVG